MTEPTRHYSPGTLPPIDAVRAAVDAAHARHRDTTDGANATVYPELARVREDLFGICIVGVHGGVHAVGDAHVEFTIMSASKPFVFALVCEQLGPDEARDLVGVNATGLPFNSLDAVPNGRGGRTNPMVNPGAIATSNLVQASTAEERWDTIRSMLSRFAGRELAINEAVYESASQTNERNQALARQLAVAGQLTVDPAEATDLYTRQCALSVSAHDLAVMGATLAGGGVNPLTGDTVISPRVCRHVLAAMATAGMYEHSGDWLWDVGLPGKSGISGGIVTVAPGKGGLGTFAPPLDAAGNSVKGTRVADDLAVALGLDVFASLPHAPDA